MKVNFKKKIRIKNVLNYFYSQWLTVNFAVIVKYKTVLK